HLNGHRDGLVWDLGDPRGKIDTRGASTFHPMKGPMGTLSLRGIIGTEPFHWRGDRSELADFNPAFMSLLGGPRQLTKDEMAAFSQFIQTLSYPPNPNENLDRTFPDPASGPSAERGRLLFTTARLFETRLLCSDCHTVSPGFGPGTNRQVQPVLLNFEGQ